MFAPRPDLEGKLALIDAETAALGLTRTIELHVKLPRSGAEAVIRGYDGRDVTGRPVHAARVATPLGVVLAVGPLDAGDLDRSAATAIVPALLGDEQAGAFRTGSDLDGDGRLDVVLRSDAGALAVWHFDMVGSGAYEISMRAPPLRGIDVDADGRVDLEGEIAPVAGDPIAPRFRDLATFAEGRYTNATIAARAYHARRAEASVAAIGAPDEARLRASLERAWHEIAGGQRSAENVLRALRKEPVPPRLRASFDAHVEVITRVAPAR